MMASMTLFRVNSKQRKDRTRRKVTRLAKAKAKLFEEMVERSLTAHPKRRSWLDRLLRRNRG
jgi:hypothetical protein